MSPRLPNNEGVRVISLLISPHPITPNPCLSRIVMRKYTLLLLLCLLGYAPFSAHAMKIEVHGNTLFAGGPVGDELVPFQEAFAAHPGIDSVVFVNSPGGDLWAGMQVGRLIREKNLRTTIAGYCNSACSIMFMGGKERTFSDAFRPAQTYIGIHGPHDTQTKAVMPQKAVQIYVFFESSIGEKFNPKVIKTALYEMDDASSMLRVFDAKRTPKRKSYHCISGKTPRKNCTEFPDDDAFSLGIVTTNDLTPVDLPPSFRQPPNIAGWALTQTIDPTEDLMKSLSLQQCQAESCRKGFTDYPSGKENRAIALPVEGSGYGKVTNRESETNAFIGAIYFCNHIKNKPSRLCETKVVNDFDLRNFYAEAISGHEEATEKLTVPAEKHYANEEFGGTFAQANGLRTQSLDDIPPTSLNGIATFSTQDLARVLKESQKPVVVDVSSTSDVIPGALTLLYGGLAHEAADKESAYETRFSGLLEQLSPDKNRAIVFYSKTRDWHAANAAMRAKKLGYTQVSWYRGGLTSWKAANMPLARAMIRAVVQ